MRVEYTKNHKKKPERNGLFAGFGARIVRSLFFWGLALILASSAYTGMVRFAGERVDTWGKETPGSAAGLKADLEKDRQVSYGKQAAAAVGEQVWADSLKEQAAAAGGPGARDLQKYHAQRRV